MDTVARAYELAAEHGMSVSQLASKSGVSVSTIKTSKSRCGQLKIDTIERICIALNMPVYQFFMSAEDWRVVNEKYAVV